METSSLFCYWMSITSMMASTSFHCFVIKTIACVDPQIKTAADIAKDASLPG
jgi:hypothetical protein